jgi:ribonuclease HI
MKTGAGVGLLFVSPLGEHMRYAVRLHFPASNNMAEYEALLCGLKIAIETGIKHLDVRGDSQLTYIHLQNIVTSGMSNITYIHKCFNISKEYLFIYMATRPEL